MKSLTSIALRSIPLVSLGMAIAISNSALAQTAFPQSPRSPQSPQQFNDRLDRQEQGYLNRRDHRTHEFWGEANQTVDISLSSTEFDTYLELYDRDGRLIAENDDSEGTNSHLQTRLPSSGVYTLVVRGFSANDYGYYSLNIRGNSSANPQPNRPIPPRRGEWRETNHLFPGDVIQHRFSVRAGEALTIRTESRQFDTYLVVYDPNGVRLAENDDSDGSTNSRIQLQARQSGDYIAEVRGFSPFMEGDYDLIVNDQR